MDKENGVHTYMEYYLALKKEILSNATTQTWKQPRCP